MAKKKASFVRLLQAIFAMLSTPAACLCVCVCADVRSHWCVTAMCLPSLMRYNLGTVFILQTCSSTHTILLGAEIWNEASLPPTRRPSNKKMEALHVCVCVGVFVSVLKCSNQKSISSSDQNVSPARGEMCLCHHCRMKTLLSV